MCYLKQTRKHVARTWERFAITRRIKWERKKSNGDREKGARCLWGAATQVVNGCGMEGEDCWLLRSAFSGECNDSSSGNKKHNEEAKVQVAPQRQAEENGPHPPQQSCLRSSVAPPLFPFCFQPTCNKPIHDGLMSSHFSFLMVIQLKGEQALGLFSVLIHVRGKEEKWLRNCLSSFCHFLSSHSASCHVLAAAPASGIFFLCSVKGRGPSHRWVPRVADAAETAR